MRQHTPQEQSIFKQTCFILPFASLITPIVIESFLGIKTSVFGLSPAVIFWLITFVVVLVVRVRTNSQQLREGLNWAIVCYVLLIAFIVIGKPRLR